MREYLLLIISLIFLCMNSCTSPTDSEKEGENVIGVQLSIEAVPDIIMADGTSESVIFVEVKQDGNYVPDSSQVLLFQTKGHLKVGRALTYHGVALDTLVSDTLAGASSVIAYYEGKRDTVMIIFAAP